MPVPKRKIDVGPIVGGVGGIIFLVVCSLLGIFLLRRKRRNEPAARKEFETVTEPFLSRFFQPSTSRKIDPDLAPGQQFPRNSQERMPLCSEGGGRDSLQLEGHMLHLQLQVDVLTREVRAGQGPPTYEEAL
ncbi:hypothetical protein B0H13DRAFT_1886994 [Mycena leptocephala]|nr:hypothetical protein B0H13DRAFT_1886994 [Mycena leptocephala]